MEKLQMYLQDPTKWEESAEKLADIVSGRSKTKFGTSELGEFDALSGLVFLATKGVHSSDVAIDNTVNVLIGGVL